MTLWLFWTSILFHRISSFFEDFFFSQTKKKKKGLPQTKNGDHTQRMCTSAPNQKRLSHTEDVHVCPKLKTVITHRGCACLPQTKNGYNTQRKCVNYKRNTKLRRKHNIQALLEPVWCSAAVPISHSHTRTAHTHICARNRLNCKT